MRTFTLRTLLLFGLLFSAVQYKISGQTILQNWTFESPTVVSDVTSSTPNISPTTANAGAITTGTVVSTFHASSATDWTSPVGNGSAESLSSNTWSIGDYFQFRGSSLIPTVIGYQGIILTWDQTGSNTGPRDFKVQYSTNGTTFTDAPGGEYALTNDIWSSLTYKPESTRSLDLTSVTDLNNKSAIYFRFVATSATSIIGSAVGASGTGRIDNVVISAVSSLPIELSTFTAKSTATSTLLSFSTATETNNSHFAIERSADARVFSEIGQVRGAGTTREPQSYTFTDERPLAGANYYRLRQVDYDGTESFSPVVSVVFSKQDRITLAPSPATDLVRIHLEEAFRTDGLWQVYDNTGRQVLSGAWEAETADAEFDVNALPEGMYTFRLVVGTSVQVKQFRKM